MNLEVRTPTQEERGKKPKRNKNKRDSRDYKALQQQDASFDTDESRRGKTRKDRKRKRNEARKNARNEKEQQQSFQVPILAEETKDSQPKNLAEHEQAASSESTPSAPEKQAATPTSTPETANTLSPKEKTKEPDTISDKQNSSKRESSATGETKKAERQENNEAREHKESRRFLQDFDQLIAVYYEGPEFEGKEAEIEHARSISAEFLKATSDIERNINIARKNINDPKQRAITIKELKSTQALALVQAEHFQVISERLASDKPITEPKPMEESNAVEAVLEDRAEIDAPDSDSSSEPTPEDAHDKNEEETQSETRELTAEEKEILQSIEDLSFVLEILQYNHARDTKISPFVNFDDTDTAIKNIQRGNGGFPEKLSQDDIEDFEKYQIALKNLEDKGTISEHLSDILQLGLKEGNNMAQSADGLSPLSARDVLLKLRARLDSLKRMGPEKPQPKPAQIAEERTSRAEQATREEKTQTTTEQSTETISPEAPKDDEDFIGTWADLISDPLVKDSIDNQKIYLNLQTDGNKDPRPITEQMITGENKESERFKNIITQLRNTERRADLFMLKSINHTESDWKNNPSLAQKDLLRAIRESTINLATIDMYAGTQYKDVLKNELVDMQSKAQKDIEDLKKQLELANQNAPGTETESESEALEILEQKASALIL